MLTATSTTMTETEKMRSAHPRSWTFQLFTSAEYTEVEIIEKLLDTQSKAEERARSEFLKTGYKKKEIRFFTYRTDLEKNQVINVYGMPYLVKSMTFTQNKQSIKAEIRAVRYE